MGAVVNYEIPAQFARSPLSFLRKEIQKKVSFVQRIAAQEVPATLSMMLLCEEERVLASTYLFRIHFVSVQ